MAGRTPRPEKDLEPIFVDGEGCHFPSSDTIDANGETYQVGDHRYVYLSMTDRHNRVLKHLENPEGFTTLQVFQFLFQAQYGKNRLFPPAKTSPVMPVYVGFFLNYDIEFWLKDIPDDAYMALQRMSAPDPDALIDAIPPNGPWTYALREDKETGRKSIKGIDIRLGRYVWRVTWIPGKKFSIGRWWENGQTWLTATIFDVFGFFQTKFTNALKEWDIPVPEAVATGKANRSSFTWADYESGMVQYYAKEEGTAGAELIYRLWHTMKEAHQKAGLHDLTIRKDHLYGPGALAKEFFETYGASTDWPVTVEDPQAMAEGPWREMMSIYMAGMWEAAATQLESAPLPLRLPTRRDIKFQDSLRFPALWAYFGGRIEAAAMGAFSLAYDYDINSAYPDAFTRLPTFNQSPQWVLGDDIGEVLHNRPVGMFFVVWEFPEGWDWYPFPFRNRAGSICFPRKGAGWVLSPEFFAVVDSLDLDLDFNGFSYRNAWMHVSRAYYWPGTEGFGDANRRPHGPQQAVTGRMLEQLITVRLQLKEAGDPANKPLKLIPNSAYGKAVQQIGRSIEDLGTFNPLVAAWCTSYTRSRIWRAIADHRAGHHILAIQTDGILSLVPLDVPVSPALGDWDVDTCRDGYQLMPGVYRFFSEKKQKTIEKQRGFGSRIDFEAVKNHFATTSDPFTTVYETFVGRLFALTQHDKLGKFARRWVHLVKEISLDIHTKRQFEAGTILPEDHLQWFPPKDFGHDDWGSVLNPIEGSPSLPYMPNFQQIISEDQLALIAQHDAENLDEGVMLIYE